MTDNLELHWNHAVEAQDWAEVRRLERLRELSPAVSDTALTLIRIDDSLPPKKPAIQDTVVSKYGDPSTENPE